MPILADILSEEDLKYYIETIGKITDIEFATSITTMDVSPIEATMLTMEYVAKLALDK